MKADLNFKNDVKLFTKLHGELTEQNKQLKEKRKLKNECGDRIAEYLKTLSPDNDTPTVEVGKGNEFSIKKIEVNPKLNKKVLMTVLEEKLDKNVVEEIYDEIFKPNEEREVKYKLAYKNTRRE